MPTGVYERGADYVPWNKMAACGVCGSVDRYPSRACRPCQKRRNAVAKERYKIDPVYREKVRGYMKKSDRKHHGRPTPTYDCPGYCECCDGTDSKSVGGFHEDHDHVTGEFRGWLCGSCNRGMGYLGDNLSGIEMAKQYLQRSLERSIVTVS